MRIGCDIDGVLADYDLAFAKLLIKISGRNLCPPDLSFPPCWDWPEAYGYTEQEISATWGDIKANPFFWRNLRPYPTAQADLDALYERQEIHGDEIYFITARRGTQVKAQTEWWLKIHCYYSEFTNPTVLISSEKDLCARALGLDAYIDDKYENVMAVAMTMRTKTFVLDRPWNQHVPVEPLSVFPVVRVSSVEEMLALLPA